MSTVLDQELLRLRAMSAAEKLAVMQALWRQGWALTAAGVRARHPQWTAEQVEDAVRQVFRTAP